MKKTLSEVEAQNIFMLTGIIMAHFYHNNIEKGVDIMVIIQTVILTIIGTEGMRISYYSSNTSNMNRKNTETRVAPGEKHFHKAEGIHPHNTEDIVQNVNVNVMTVTTITGA